MRLAETLELREQPPGRQLTPFRRQACYFRQPVLTEAPKSLLRPTSRQTQCSPSDFEIAPSRGNLEAACGIQIKGLACNMYHGTVVILSRESQLGSVSRTP